MSYGISFIISNLFCYKFITRQQIVLNQLSVYIKLLYLLTFTFAIKQFLEVFILTKKNLNIPKLKILKHIHIEIDFSLVAVVVVVVVVVEE